MPESISTNTPLQMDRRVNLLAIAAVFNALSFSIVLPFLPLYLHKVRGIPMGKVGTAFLVMGLARLCVPLLSGAFADRFGRRKLLVAGPILRGFTFLVLAQLTAVNAPIMSLYAMLFVVTSLGVIYQTTASAYTVDITTPDTRVDAFSRTRLGMNVGWLIGPALGAFLARTPFSVLFLVTGGFCFAGAIISFVCFDETHRKSPERKEEGSVGGWINNEMLRDGVLATCLFLGFLVWLTKFQFVSTLSVFSTTAVGISKNQLGLLYTSNGLVICLLQLPLSSLLDGRTRFMTAVNLHTRLALGALIYFVGYFGIGFSAGYLGLIVTMVFISLGEIVFEPTMAARVSHLAPRGMLGRYMGFLAMVRGTSSSFGPFIGGLLYDAFGGAGGSGILLWGLLSSSTLVAMFGYIWLRVRDGSEAGIPNP